MLPQGAEINAWLAIDTEGNVTIRVPHTEMGQGALMAFSMMIAEVLTVDWSRVRAVFADPNPHLRNDNEYRTMNTSGSAVVRRQHPHIMQAGASARERLKEAAARAWGLERNQVEVTLGTLKSGSRTGTYAEFATAAAATTLPEEPAIKKKVRRVVAPRQVAASPGCRREVERQRRLRHRRPGPEYGLSRAAPASSP